MTALRAVFGLVVVLLAVAAAYLFVERDRQSELAATRRALELRASELQARTLAPGSPLACLNGISADAVETACERVVFARPETAAAAVTLMAARLDLLIEASAVRHIAPTENMPVATLRRAVELDRFGIVAHVLSTRDGCTPDSCAAFAALRDSSVIKSNLRFGVFDQYVSRHAPRWEQPAQPSKEPPLASLSPSAPAAAEPRQPGANVDFPSAASIPPVSIMNAEPKLPAGSESQAAAPANPAEKPQPQRRSQTPPPAR